MLQALRVGCFGFPAQDSTRCPRCAAARLAPPSVELSRCRAWLACPGFKTGLERAWCFRVSRYAPDCASPDLSRLRPKQGCGGSLSGIYHHSVADAGLHGAARIKVGYLGHFVAVRSGSALALQRIELHASINTWPATELCMPPVRRAGWNSSSPCISNVDTD